MNNLDSNQLMLYFQPRSTGPATAPNIQLGLLGTVGLGQWSIQPDWWLGSSDWSEVEKEFLSQKSNSGNT